MAKKRRHKEKNKQATAQKPGAKADNQNVFSQHPALFSILAMMVLLFVFYSDVTFGNKEFQQGDVYANKSFEPFVEKAFEQGTYPLWCPYIFCGMPSYASLMRAPRVNIFDTAINTVVRGISSTLGISFFLRQLVNYLLLGSMVFLLLRTKGVNVLAALFGGIALTFVPQFVSFAAFGHNTKILATSLIPLIFLLTDKLLEKKSLTFFSLAAIAIGWQLMRAHVQISYYTMMMIGLLFIYHAIMEYRDNKNVKGILTGGGLLAGAIVAGIMLCLVLYFSVYEYSHYSIRGGGTSGGLDYAYATNWSFSPLELTTFIIPSFVGFGGATYWGQMPNTDYPLYMGIVPLFLAGLAFVVKRDRTTIFFGILAALSLLVSFGKTFPVLYTPLFELLPFFNKFRVPLMIQVLLEFSVAALAAFAIHGLTTADPKRVLKNVKTYVYVFAGICAIIALVIFASESAYGEWMMAGAKPYWQQFNSAQLSGLVAAAYDAVVNDALKMLALLAATIFLTIYFLNKKMSATLFGLSMIALLIIDLWYVDYRINKPAPAANEAAYFAETNAVRFLKQQPGPFRIFPADGKSPNWYAYFGIQSIYGYQTARLRIYDDFLNKAALTSRQSLQMLNVRYLVSMQPIADPSFREVVKGDPAQRQPFVYEFVNALPRAWFVDDIKVVPDVASFYELLKSGDFNPAQTAVLTRQPELHSQASDSSEVEVTSYGIQEIELDVHAPTGGHLVLSEIYYPAGWKAYVDGEQTEIYQTDAILRSIVVPAGASKVRFIFDPASFTSGIWVSVLTLLGLAGLLLYDLKFRSRRKTAPADELAMANA